jgi:hypothetical protein
MAKKYTILPVHQHIKLAQSTTLHSLLHTVAFCGSASSLWGVTAIRISSLEISPISKIQPKRADHGTLPFIDHPINASNSTCRL